jgi:hypothetical protein
MSSSALALSFRCGYGNSLSLIHTNLSPMKNQNAIPIPDLLGSLKLHAYYAMSSRSA